MPKRPFRVGRSRTGLGLFATRPIRKRPRIAEYKGRLLTTKEAEQARGARQPLPLRNQQPLDHRRHAAQQYRALLQPFLQSQRRNIRRQAPGVHPDAARHQAGRGNHLRLRRRLSEERDRALELQMRPLPAAARPQGARTARAAKAAAGAAAGQTTAEIGEEQPFVFAPARSRGHARRIILPRHQRPAPGDLRAPRPAPARRARRPRPARHSLYARRHRDVCGLDRDRRNGRSPATRSPRCCSSAPSSRSSSARC